MVALLEERHVDNGRLLSVYVCGGSLIGRSKYSILLHVAIVFASAFSHIFLFAWNRCGIDSCSLCGS